MKILNSNYYINTVKIYNRAVAVPSNYFHNSFLQNVLPKENFQGQLPLDMMGVAWVLLGRRQDSPGERLGYSIQKNGRKCPYYVGSPVAGGI